MAIIGFIANLLSGAIFLLFAVRFMRVGIERLWRTEIQNSLSAQTSILSLLAKGTTLGFLMQGATVVMIMTAGLAGSGVVPMASAVVVALGADLGSALAVKLLSLPVSAIGPFAILIGGWLYLNAPSVKLKNLGRVSLGLGMVFLALLLIRTAVAPLQELSSAMSVLAYLNKDPVAAALFGMTLSLLMHSSLAAILTALAFASQGVLDPVGGAGFVIGCNIGSALLPIWLLRREADESLTIAKTVAVIRIALAVSTLCFLSLLQNQLSGFAIGAVDQFMLLFHLGFNTASLLLAPCAAPLCQLLSPKTQSPKDSSFTLPDIPHDPTVILSACRGQVSRMLDLLSEMHSQVMKTVPDVTIVQDLEDQINASLADLRRVFANLSSTETRLNKNVQESLEFAIRIESCADILSGKFMTIRQEGVQGEYKLSGEGQQEIQALGLEVLKGMHLAQSVFWNADTDVARQLVLHKQDTSKREADSRRNHLRRVQMGNLTSLSSSNHHLELIAALKSVNSKLATIGYAVLDTAGELKKTRLKSVK